MSKAYAGKVNLLRRVWDFFFKPSLDVYKDAPRHPSGRGGTARRVKAGKEKGTSGNHRTKIARRNTTGRITKRRSTEKSKRKGKKTRLESLPLNEQGLRLGYIDRAGVVRMKATGQKAGQVKPEDFADKARWPEILGGFVELDTVYAQRIDALFAKGEKLSAVDLPEVEKMELSLKEQPGLGGDTKLRLGKLEKIQAILQTNLSRLNSEKIKLLQQIEKLPASNRSGSLDWAEADGQIVSVRKRWQEFPALAKSTEEVLEKRFEASLRSFRARKHDFFHNHEKNAVEKRKLIEQANNLVETGDLRAANRIFPRILTSWNAIGPATAGDEARFSQELSAAQQRLQQQNQEEFLQKKKFLSQLFLLKTEMLEKMDEETRGLKGKELREFLDDYGLKLDRIEAELGEDGDTILLREKLATLLEFGKKEVAQQDERRVDQVREVKSCFERLKILSTADEQKMSWQVAENELDEIAENSHSFDLIGNDLRKELKQAITQAGKDLSRKKTSYFKRMSQERLLNAEKKRTLINDLPLYRPGLRAGELSAHIKTSMDNWKKTGPANKEVDDELWSEYRKLRGQMLARVKELSELEKAELAESFAASFSRKRRLLQSLEIELTQDQERLEATADRKKNIKLKAEIESRENRILNLQNDLLGIQRKLAKLSSGGKGRGRKANGKEKPVPYRKDETEAFATSEENQ